jgi:hypothetical protein
MKEWPKFNERGDLPIGIHRATLAEVIDHFGKSSFQRALVAQRPERIYSLACQTGKEDEAVAFWQGKRDGEKRGIVEVISND